MFSAEELSLYNGTDERLPTLLAIIGLDQELGETTSCLVESLYLLEESEMKPVMFALKHEKHHFGCVLNLFHIRYLSS
ncbi:unnamed protein product [Rhodiola kirilowii]